MTEEGKKYPKKYWWLVLLVLPVILALIPVLPGLFKKEDKTGDSQTGKGNIHQAGTGNVNESVNILNSDLSSKMYVTNVSIIASEYERTHGHPLTDGDLKEQIERAVAEAEAGRHTKSIQLLEKLSKNVPLPAIYTSLGVEYAKAGNTDAATKAFSSAIDKDPSYEPAHLNRAIVAVSEGKPNEALPDLEKASSINQTKEVLKVAQQELRKESQGNAATSSINQTKEVLKVAQHELRKESQGNAAKTVSSASPSPPRTRSASISFVGKSSPNLIDREPSGQPERDSSNPCRRRRHQDNGVLHDQILAKAK